MLSFEYFLKQDVINYYIILYYIEKFQIKSKRMNHRKKEHKPKIKVCRNSSNGLCKFNSDCWYRHEEYQGETKNKNENQEVLDKIYEMMKMFTNRNVNTEN